MAKDLRTFLQLLKEKDQLFIIKDAVDPKTEMSSLVWEAAEKRAIFFEQLKGYLGWRACGSMMGNRSRLALVLGIPPEEILPYYSKMIKGEKIPPQEVSTGPVKEVIWKGKEIDLGQLPIWLNCEQDVAPYITFGQTISRDPDTGVYNVAMVRHQILRKNETSPYCVRGRHTWMNYQKYEKRNEPMPVAIAMGHHPAFHLAGLYYGSYEDDELEMAGLFLGEPLRVVQAETVDVKVPADAEVVIEGEMLPHTRVR